MKLSTENTFKFIESDEPMLTDDMYELIANDNISIQITDECCAKYIVNEFVEDGDESCSIYHGTYNNLKEAKKKALSIK